MKRIRTEKSASHGIAMGKLFVVRKEEAFPADYMPDGVEKEKKKYDAAVAEVKKELEMLGTTSTIWAAHIELVKDEALKELAFDKLNEGQNVQQAVYNSYGKFITMFENLEDEYMRERAADMKDIRDRLLRKLQHISVNPFAAMTEKAIVIAEDLMPSDTALIDDKLLLGLVTEQGGINSHIAIIAKDKGVPAIVGISNLMDMAAGAKEMILDANENIIIFDPEEAMKREYQEKIEREDLEKAYFDGLKKLPAETTDGVRIPLCANVGSVEEIIKAKEYGFDGIGLFRSELLYMNNTHFPTEEEQLTVYRAAVLTAEKSVVVRTLDIGGDKALPYYEFEKEANPFLGLRAIRFCMERKDIFKTQLRALLRAGVYGELKIMYPMITSVAELDEANAILKECKQELEMEGIAYQKEIPVGIMIETPAAVFCAEELAKKVDFFSIGTNDLTQYITAADRGNRRVAYLYDSKHPAVIRAIKLVIAAGHRAHIPVAMCGELASEESMTKVLLGLGLDEFSMSPGKINRVKAIIRNVDYKKCAVDETVREI